jgi:hypothetical protein
VHWYRNIFSHAPSTKVQEIAAMLKAIHANEDLAAAREKANRVIEKLRGLRLSRAAELVETAVKETLTCYAFPEEHWRRIRTNNPLERILREIRRRTRVVAAFPDGQLALNLAAARLRQIAGTAWSTKRSEHRAAERPADERCHHGVSHCRAPLSPNQMCERVWTLPEGESSRSGCNGLDHEQAERRCPVSPTPPPPNASTASSIEICRRCHSEHLLACIRWARPLI